MTFLQTPRNGKFSADLGTARVLSGLCVRFRHSHSGPEVRLLPSVPTALTQVLTFTARQALTELDPGATTHSAGSAPAELPRRPLVPAAPDNGPFN